MVLNVHTETTRLIRDGEKGEGGMEVGEETLLCRETTETLTEMALIAAHLKLKNSPPSVAKLLVCLEEVKRR